MSKKLVKEILKEKAILAVEKEMNKLKNSLFGSLLESKKINLKKLREKKACHKNGI